MDKVVNFTEAQKQHVKKLASDEDWRDQYGCYNFKVDPYQFETEKEFKMCIRHFLLLEELYNGSDF